MAIDRKRRDLAADALAAFLRGESELSDVQTLFEEILRLEFRLDESRDRFLFDLSITMTLGPNRIPRVEMWKKLRVALAFLKTDLEPTWTPHNPDSDRILREPRVIWEARIHFVALVAAMFGGWLWYIPAYLVSFIRFQFLTMLEPDPAPSAATDRRLEPFPSAEALADGERVLEQLRVPEFDPHFQERLPGEGDAGGTAGIFFFFFFAIPCVALLYVFVLGSYVVCHPIWLFLIGLGLDRKSPDERTDPA